MREASPNPGSGAPAPGDRPAGGGSSSPSSSPPSSSWWWQERWESIRRGETPIALSWEGGQATGVLFDVGAPRTAAAVFAALPLQVPVVHVAWSGEMVMSARTYELGVERENAVRLPRPGDLTWDPAAGELAFAYGTAECRLPSGENNVVVYGAIVEGLDAFAEFCRRRRFEGVGQLRIESA
ncbi:MAG TPA: DUF3830 family protein [Solirubrobacteraceae bacterium]|nr:DUF3830 family protein [Solirubrobacteraceae bacterium]